MAQVLVGFWLLVIIVSIANIVRLHYYSKFLIAEVDRIFDIRINGDRSVTYPAFPDSYYKFKWYDLFNYKFDKLVVYE